MKKRIKWIVSIGIGIGILLLLVLSALFPPSFYFPHKKPLIILPIDPKYDSLSTLMPMGEKINHPDAPSGHPGIDFGFDSVKERVPYIASMDGTVSTIRIYDNPEKSTFDNKPITTKMADIVIKNKSYQTKYGELDSTTLSEKIKKGSEVKQGDFIGYGNEMESHIPGTVREMIHWEFGSTSPVIDRFCPLEYFTEESRVRIEKIWAATDWPEMKAQYPKICNGDYYRKTEK